jgi:hypothetical protein
MLKFYDANLSYGLANNTEENPLKPCPEITELDGALTRAGVSGGLVRCMASDVSGVVFGNNLLKKALEGVKNDLYGMYTLLPSYTHEIPKPADLPAVMNDGRFAALRIAPARHRYLAKPGLLSDYLEMAVERKIPFVMDMTCGLTAGEAYDFMEAFPNLTAIYAPSNEWPTDRFDFPFLARYPNLCFELSTMFTDQGIESLVREFGSKRLLYGSNFPNCYMGGGMLMVKQADISDADKEAIAGGNLLRLIREAVL